MTTSLCANSAVGSTERTNLSFVRVFRDTYADQITYFPQSRINAIDPFAKRITTEFETIDFKEAILAPPQQAAELAWQAGLIGRDGHGKPSGWAAQDPVHLNAQGDERIFLAGDMVDKASPLFGFYPKTGQIAARQGAIAAQEIARRISGQPPEKAACRPAFAMSCAGSARSKSAASTPISASVPTWLIQQTIRQTHYPQAEDEDKRWAAQMFTELGF